MQKIQFDLPVAIIFFNRPFPLQKVFEAVKKAKPNKLFLIQDGARNDGDIEKIIECRKIFDHIDWDCKVYKNYSEVNLSCDHRVFTGISWAFEKVDRLIILEDDCVPSQSFFTFCAELLERYKDDERIHMISGMNYLDKFDEVPDSYFFSNVAAGWGWATWKRIWQLTEDQKDFNYLEDEYLFRKVADYTKNIGIKTNNLPDFNNLAQTIRNKNLMTNKTNSWENALGISLFLNSTCIITPKKNLVSNIGLTDDSTHAVDSLRKLDKATQKLFFKKTFELDFPLKHPKYVIRNLEYERIHRKITGGNKINRIFRKIEGVSRRLIFSNYEDRKKMIKKFLGKC